MCFQGMYSRAMIKYCRLSVEALPLQIFNRSIYTFPHCSGHDSSTHIPSSTVISHSSSATINNFNYKNGQGLGQSSNNSLPHRNFVPSLPVTRSLSSSTIVATFNKKNLSNLSSSWKHMFSALPGQSSHGSASNLLSWVIAGGVSLPSGMAPTIRHASQSKNGFTNIHSRISSLQAKKRTQRKKKQQKADSEEEWQVTAYATADEYNLEKLLDGLTRQGLYTRASITPGNHPSEHGTHRTASGLISGGRAQATSSSASSMSPPVPDANDVLHMVATYQLETEHREIYFFREGSVVFWNVAELERANVLRYLKSYEEGKYDEQAVEEESESLTYRYSEGPSKTKLVNDKIFLNPEGQTDLEKYTFSNAMTLSVKLGIWEASLDRYINNIEYVSEVMNVKLNHCIELMELLKSHLSEQHASRLEWIIIILIMVEVGFELLHFLERLY